MIRYSCASGKTILQICRYFIGYFAIISLLIVFNAGATAQSSLTRKQFSSLSVLSRAAYFEKEILRAANEEGVDPHILWVIAYNETRFRPWLTSPKNARGMMQFIPATAARFGLADPYKAVPAIRAAARYVKYLSNLFGRRIDSVLAAYNAGEGTVSAYLYGRSLRNGRKIINPNGIKTIGGVPPYRETLTYVGRGLKIYRWLAARGAFPGAVVRANFPTLISSMVARARVSDRELGSVPDLGSIAATPATQPERATSVKREVTGKNTQDEEQTSTGSTEREVYYDSRSGNRYLVNNGKKEKLADPGIVVINETSRPQTTNQARSTFFAGPANK